MTHHAVDSELLTKAEAAGVTPAEAQALTARGTELMARYSIDRALLTAEQSDADQPSERITDTPTRGHGFGRTCYAA